MTGLSLPTALIGAAGEYFVAAELSRRGWLATVTIKNAPGTDVLAQHHNTKALVSIQTKTTKGGGSWVLGVREETPTALDNEWVVLVSMGGASATRSPRFWVLPRNHVAAYLWVSHRRWLRAPARTGTPHVDSTMRGVKASDITDYEGQWEWLHKQTSEIPYSLMPDWLIESVTDPSIGLRNDHPDAAKLGAAPIPTA